MDVDVDDGGIDSGALGTPATPETPASGGGTAVGDSPIRSALAAAAARRLAAATPGTTRSDVGKEEVLEVNGKSVSKGGGAPAIDQATLESIDHRRGECN